MGVMRAGHKGYVDAFEKPKLFPGRMAEAAKWIPTVTADNADKHWLMGTRRLIFISDMGDALSKMDLKRMPGRRWIMRRAAWGHSLTK
jgi:hypothetical protein